MKLARALVSIALCGAAAAACSAAPDSGSSSASDEALNNCGATNSCGGDPGTPPTPTSGSTCPAVNPLCTSSPASFSGDQWTLYYAGCNSPIFWSTPNVGEYLALCPKTTTVYNWVLQHPGSAEVNACDTCIPHAGRYSVWVRLGPSFHVDCGDSRVNGKYSGGGWCNPNCPSGCGATVW